jgi:hypothetical protein
MLCAPLRWQAPVAAPSCPIPKAPVSGLPGFSLPLARRRLPSPPAATGTGRPLSPWPRRSSTGRDLGPVPATECPRAGNDTSKAAPTADSSLSAGITNDLPQAWPHIDGSRPFTRARLPIAVGEASGSVNRSLRPDSVRHVSVTTAMQGLTAARHDTQRDNSKAAREPGYAQATGRFRRWWQVLGSNQRRLSRRFYRQTSFTVLQAADLGVQRCSAPLSPRRSVQVPRRQSIRLCTRFQTRARVRRRYTLTDTLVVRVLWLCPGARQQQRSRNSGVDPVLEGLDGGGDLDAGAGGCQQIDDGLLRRRLLDHAGEKLKQRGGGVAPRASKFAWSVRRCW